jgi:hypothetical protein
MRQRKEAVITLYVRPGYGKSLVIIYAALQLAEKGDNVIIVVPNEFLKAQALSQYKVDIKGWDRSSKFTKTSRIFYVTI